MFLMTLEFSRKICEKKNSQTSNFMKILLVEAELSHANRQDGQTDITKLTVAFNKFCEYVYIGGTDLNIIQNLFLISQTIRQHSYCEDTFAKGIQEKLRLILRT